MTKRPAMTPIAALSLSMLLGCGPALTEQLRLRSLADRATADCKAQRARCGVALVCTESAQTAAKAIQSAQEARAAGGASAAQEATAAGSYAAAVASCATGGWR